MLAGSTMFLIIFTLIVCILGYYWVCRTSKPLNFPPGPPRYPIVGSTPFMKPSKGAKPSIFWAVCQFAKKYGSIFGFYLGNHSTVVLTNYEDIKEVFNKEEASHRPPITGHKFRPGWKSAVDVEPELNRQQPPGVIFTNVRCFF